MIFDSHVHTVFSTDADTTLAQALQVSAEKNTGLVITDHMDVDFPAPWPEFRVDLPGYFRACAPLRSERLLLGIELGLTERSLTQANEIAAGYDFDFVLGSVHVMDGREVDDTFYRDEDELAVYRRYLRKAARLMETADVDAFAHVDYPLRSTRTELPCDAFRAELTELYEALVRWGIVLELNTSRLGDEAARANLLEMYRLYAQCGGRYATLGSVAHEPQEIGDHFSAALDFLQTCQLSPVHFCRRRMVVDQ